MTEWAHHPFQQDGAVGRQRIARALRQGVQERLAGLVLELQLAEEALPPGIPGAGESIARALDSARAALDQLRELTSRIHPPGLDLRGLSPCLAALAAQSPVPVAISRVPDIRLPSSVEAGAYFFVVAALAHAVDERGATRADVAVDLADHLEVTVRHDGRTDGARPARPALLRSPLGSGGTVRVTVANGETTLRALIPTGGESAPAGGRTHALDEGDPDQRARVTTAAFHSRHRGNRGRW
ncbi:histidine kinase [Actinomadura sp. NPDC049753]|uniref:sensor histidine kinase n=1 Tax=Actinomadura sp. NPDC049753 TaxID=3154739 RepID=UPI0034237A2C